MKPSEESPLSDQIDLLLLLIISLVVDVDDAHVSTSEVAQQPQLESPLQLIETLTGKFESQGAHWLSRGVRQGAGDEQDLGRRGASTTEIFRSKFKVQLKVLIASYIQRDLIYTYTIYRINHNLFAFSTFIIKL